MSVWVKFCAGRRGQLFRSSSSGNSATVSRSPGIDRPYEAWLQSQLPYFDVLTVTDETAIAYAALRLALKRSGRQIPVNDAWIAALGQQHRLPVLSRNQHSDGVPDLERKSW